jgi:hypothetical protein
VRYLFVHQNFPGQYLHIIRHLLKDPANEVVFISEPSELRIPGVRRVGYDMPRERPAGLAYAVSEYHWATMRAERVAAVARNIRALGFTPDIIIGHHGWGELLNLEDVFRGTPILACFTQPMVELASILPLSSRSRSCTKKPTRICSETPRQC